MAIATALLILLLATPTVFAVEYTVGDNNEWNSGVDYTTWVSDKKFAVGDVLVFKYSGNHQVDVVSKSDYDSCSSGNAIQSYSDGNTKISLTTAGDMHFICPTIGHCAGGMKLAVTVAASSSGGGGGGGGTTPSTPSTPSGSTPTPTTPSSSVPTPTSTDTGAAASNICNMNMMLLISLLFGVLVLAFMG